MTRAFKVSAVRHDGEVQCTTVMDYHAESLAFQLAKQLEESKHIHFVGVYERHENGHGGTAWLVVKSMTKEREVNDD